MFAGRLEEIEQLERTLFQARGENSTHFLIVGERGIGKSSLLFYVENVAAGHLPIQGEEKFRFVTVAVELEQSDTAHTILAKLTSRLTAELAPYAGTKERAARAWEVIKRFEVGGIKYNDVVKQAVEHELLDAFCDALASADKDLRGTTDGVVVLIDEADKPDASADLGTILKLTTERLTKLQAERVCFGLSGLPGVLQKLQLSHASSPRVLEHISLSPLLPAERHTVVTRGLAEAAAKSAETTTIDDLALNRISDLSEGYPHFIQQFAYSAFEADGDNHIDDADVVRGAFRENGAFEQLGRKYFQDLYFEKINSEEYRSVLRAIAEAGTPWITKREIQAATALKASTLTNAINALKKRNIILRKEGSTGVYRLPSSAFGVWIRAFTGARRSDGD